MSKHKPTDVLAGQQATDAVWRYFIQREVQGLISHDPVIEFYQIPREVLARVGASSKASPG
jgi:hypothetical protein